MRFMPPLHGMTIWLICPPFKPSPYHPGPQPYQTIGPMISSVLAFAHPLALLFPLFLSVVSSLFGTRDRFHVRKFSRDGGKEGGVQASGSNASYGERQMKLCSGPLLTSSCPARFLTGGRLVPVLGRPRGRGQLFHKTIIQASSNITSSSLLSFPRVSILSFVLFLSLGVTSLSIIMLKCPSLNVP